jgi:erythromycin esterase-like protein
MNVGLVLASLDPIEFAFKEFGAYGVIGAVAMVLAFVLWRREKERTALIAAWDAERAKINEARLVDFRDLMNRGRDDNVVQEKIAATMGERNTSVNRLAEAIDRLSEVIKKQSEAIARFEATLEKAWESNRELRDALMIHGGLRPSK